LVLKFYVFFEFNKIKFGQLKNFLKNLSAMVAVLSYTKKYFSSASLKAYIPSEKQTAHFQIFSHDAIKAVKNAVLAFVNFPL
jgi:hypothetical protein